MRNGSDLSAKLFRGLGDPSRLRVLLTLRDGPLTVGEIVRQTRLSQPGVSMHLGCLAECGLVRWERQGRFVAYELADKGIVRLLDEAEDLLRTVGPLIRACANYPTPGSRGARRAPARARRRA